MPKDKAELLIAALKDAGYRDARFLLISTKRVDLMVEAPVKARDEKNPHVIVDWPKDIATQKHAVVVELAKAGIRFKGMFKVLPPRILVEDVQADVGQAQLAPDYAAPEDAIETTEAKS